MRKWFMTTNRTIPRAWSGVEREMIRPRPLHGDDLDEAYSSYSLSCSGSHMSRYADITTTDRKSVLLKRAHAPTPILHYISYFFFSSLLLILWRRQTFRTALHGAWTDLDLALQRRELHGDRAFLWVVLAIAVFSTDIILLGRGSDGRQAWGVRTVQGGIASQVSALLACWVRRKYSDIASWWICSTSV